jgi:hypothetical protein
MLGLIKNTKSDLMVMFYRIMGWMPTPAHDKWTGSLQLFRMHIRLMNQASADEPWAVPSDDLAARSLHETGRRWVEKRFLWFNKAGTDLRATRDTFAIAAETLGLPSTVDVHGTRVTITTFLCPFLDDAKRAGEDLAATCERVCGEQRSFFKGMSEGFPYVVDYTAPLRMGRGTKVCLKQMHVGNRIPRKAPRSATGRQPVLVERSALAGRLREMQQATPSNKGRRTES